MQQRDRLPIVALICGALAAIAAFLIFWMVFISVGLGIAAVVLGMRSRGRDAGDTKGRELAAAAIALGLVGILGTGGSWIVSAQAEDFGRDCALDPNPDC
ncbi:MAG: hypothetical protein M3526_03760 [Actinomycetota bacterium]|nr:hypothetical protein [Actinomycetota bacterium]